MRSDEEVIEQIKDLLETKVSPAVAGHGGAIGFTSYKDGHLVLELQGSSPSLPVLSVSEPSAIASELVCDLADEAEYDVHPEGVVLCDPAVVLLSPSFNVTSSSS